jgi:hypothetical protein
MGTQRLSVLMIGEGDVYKDIVRVNETFRIIGGKLLTEGSLGRLTCRERSVYVVIRGNQDREEAAIWMDGRTRDRLGISAGQQYEFGLRKAGCWGSFRWAIGSSDMAYRVMAYLAVLSVILGAAGCVLGILGFVR